MVTKYDKYVERNKWPVHRSCNYFREGKLASVSKLKINKLKIKIVMQNRKNRN